jgi:DGQHR domain-containing protein
MATVQKIKAIRMDQRVSEDKDVFTTVLPVELLIDETSFKINWWDATKKGTSEQGYQRIPDESRKKSIYTYLEAIKDKDPVLPTNIVVSSRNSLKFKGDKGGFGELTLDNYPLWIIDGQNRVEGFKYAIQELGAKHLLKYEMPVTILANFSKEDEILQFITLNVNQKKVKTDLAQVLRKQIMINLGEKRYRQVFRDTWDLKALSATELLNSKSDLSNPWFGRIKEPNSKNQPNKIMTQNSFISSLRPLFKGGIFDGEVFSADERYVAIKNYWDALEDIFPDAFMRPQEYVIQKTPGVFSLNDLANTIFQLLLKEKKAFNKTDIREKLHMAFPDKEKYNDNYWMRSNDIGGAARAGSMKGFRQLADEFRRNLEKSSS